MINPNTLYKVTGVYKNGQMIVGCHLVGEDGSQSDEDRERVIWMINRGIITNMRLQKGKDNEIILRGKGVNLNNLPTIKMTSNSKNLTSSNNCMQGSTNGGVNGINDIRKSTQNTKGMYKITKRIMYKTSCLGYEIQDYKGNTTRVKRDDAIKLALQKLIINASAGKRYIKEKNLEVVDLIGKGCDLRAIPILIVDNTTGKIVDPSKEKSNLTVRSAYMKHSGIICNTLSNTKIPFKGGDFILCGADGKIQIKDRISVEHEYVKDTESASAVCDDYLSLINDYYIEIFGSKPIRLTNKMVKSWAILKPRTTK